MDDNDYHPSRDQMMKYIQKQINTLLLPERISVCRVLHDLYSVECHQTNSSLAINFDKIRIEIIKQMYYHILYLKHIIPYY